MVNFMLYEFYLNFKKGKKNRRKPHKVLTSTGSGLEYARNKCQVA